MNILVTDKGFSKIDEYVEPFSPDSKVEDIDLSLGVIAIAFPSFSDGRGFSLASSLRRKGYKGRLRASGHILADQYTMIRRVGFDEVEISPELAARQDESQWLVRSDWKNNDYQSKLGKRR